jgi:hypothetical protein
MMNTSNNEQYNANLDPSIEHWTDKQFEEFRSWLISHLKMGPVTVTFTKKDGEVRVMKCTLQPELLPPQTTVNESKKKENTNNISAFDLNKNEWRSFIVKNIKRVEFEL